MVLRIDAAIQARRAVETIPLTVLLLDGCLDPVEYPCDSTTQCAVDGKNGVCHASGWCVYDDEDCESGLRYGPAAGNGLAGECAESDTPGGSAGTTSSATMASTAATTDCGECSSPPGFCFASVGSCDSNGDCMYEPLAAGTACDDEDECTKGEKCDGAGECVAAQTVTCNVPPTTCHASRGSCNVLTGKCEHDPMPAGSDCDGANGCDACDTAGVCVAGAMCLSRDPCEVGACVMAACVFMPAVDGTGCGATAADRCCAGACVDISTDPLNCGGCGTDCELDEACESIAVTTQCEPYTEENRTGRCTCTNDTTDCRNGQVCVTAPPVIDRCAPPGPANCPGGIFVEVDSCPNYCEYGD